VIGTCYCKLGRRGPWAKANLEPAQAGLWRPTRYTGSRAAGGISLAMRKPLIVLSGTGVRTFQERAPSATEALRLVREHMRLRRLGVRIEDEHGNPVSFFQLKEMAELEAKNVTAPNGHPRSSRATSRPR
jgi:hypothetical protein